MTVSCFINHTVYLFVLVPEEFLFDPTIKSYGDPRNRPELQNCTIEYIAPSEYMLRPPQPAVYLFLFDITASAIESGTYC